VLKNAQENRTLHNGHLLSLWLSYEFSILTSAFNQHCHKENGLIFCAFLQQLDSTEKFGYICYEKSITHALHVLQTFFALFFTETNNM
jgi:hypothetical protein